MLYLIAAPGCPSCRKTKQWLKEHEIPYTEKNLYRLLLDDSEQELLFRLYRDGVIELNNENAIDQLFVDQQGFFEYLREHPSMVERPVLYRWKENADGVINLKKMEMAPNSSRYCHPGCSNWLVCGKVRHPNRKIPNDNSIIVETQMED